MRSSADPTVGADVNPQALAVALTSQRARRSFSIGFVSEPEARRTKLPGSIPQPTSSVQSNALPARTARRLPRSSTLPLRCGSMPSNQRGPPERSTSGGIVASVTRRSRFGPSGLPQPVYWSQPGSVGKRRLPKVRPRAGAESTASRNSPASAGTTVRSLEWSTSREEARRSCRTSSAEKGVSSPG